MSIPVPIIDSHIHLFPSSELSTLAWNEPSNPLWKQHSLTEYRRAISSSHDLLSGFIFLETDRKTAPDEDDNDTNDSDANTAKVNPAAAPEEGGYSWKYPLQEVSFLARIASGKPRDETEGHTPQDKDLCLGIVPWAPLPAGPEVLEKYIDAVRETATRDGDESVWGKIKGFRYLLQDKPDGTMLEQKFIDGLKLLGRKGLVFDVGVDQHRRGRKQLEETVEMIERAHEGVKPEEKVTFILSESIDMPIIPLWRPILTPCANKRPPLQTRPHRPQPRRSKLHRLANRHLHPFQSRQCLHVRTYTHLPSLPP